MSRLSINIFTDVFLPTQYTKVINAVSTDLSDYNWPSLSLQLNLQNTGQHIISGPALKIHYVFLDTDIDPTVAANTVIPTGTILTILHIDPAINNGTIYITGPTTGIMGDYLYTWMETADSLKDLASVKASLDAVENTNMTQPASYY